MRNGLYTKLLLLFCAMAGCFAGYGIDAFLEKEDAKDNTLVRKEYDGVFFSEELSATPMPSVTEEPVVSPTPVPVEVLAPVPTREPDREKLPTPTVRLPQPTITVTGITPTSVPERIPTPTVTETVTPVPTQKPETVFEEPEKDKQEVVTYPAEIFGQVPVIDRTDGTVTYFEFAMDLISLVETEIRQKNLNEISLFTKFMVKALFCGIDIEELQINEPIPRRQAALAIHLAAEVMGKNGTIKNAKNATSYAPDVGNCSSAEKKAVIYLYERGAVSRKKGQKFDPDSVLTEADCSVWRKHLKAEWQ